jgi:phage head maturation protease
MTLDFGLYLPISKIDEEKRMVWGYASTPTKDLQGEIVKVSAIKNALPDYLQWSNIREMHQNSAVGITVEHNVSEKGLYIGAHIVDDSAWKKCKPLTPGKLDSVYKGFSIGGNTIEKVGDTITEIKLIEISLVDRPANSECRIDSIKLEKGIAEVTMAGADLDEPSRNTLFEKFLDTARNFFGTEKFSATGEPVLDLYEAATLLEVEKREFKQKEREHLASTGAALPDGSFPISNTSDLHNAIQAHGRAKDKEKAKRHIIARAHALGATHMLPAGWGEGKSLTIEDTDMKLEEAQALAKKYGITVEELSKRLSKSRAMHFGKAMEHLHKAQREHDKCMKCLGKSLSDGTLFKTLIASGLEKGEAESLVSHLHKMSDEHDMVEHHMGKAAGGHVSQGGMAPIDASYDDSGDVKEKPQSELTEGEVEDISMFGTNSPYDEHERHESSARGGNVNKKELTDLIKSAVIEATKPLEKQLNDLKVENAELKGAQRVLASMPGAGRRANLFALDKSAPAVAMLGDGSDDKSAVNEEIGKAFSSMDRDDPDSMLRGTARIIGLRATHPNMFGKSIFDPEYKGGAGSRRGV